jgi:hypothetical protein
MTKKHIAIKLFLFGIIMLGTAIDVFWSVVVAETLYVNELNPYARWLIFRGDQGMPDLPNSGVALLCGLKIIGTWIALQILDFIIQRYPRVGWASTAGMSVFMVYLVWFLSF